MKKILMIVCGLIFSSHIIASQQPPSLIICPTTLTCNYHAGTCNLPAGEWVIGNTYGLTPWIGSKTINLNYIVGMTYYTDGNKKITQISCSYQAPPYDGLHITTTIKNYVGVGWSFFGWGGDQATCQSITDPRTCEGTN